MPLLVIGESPVAGWGVARHDEALTARLAQSLADQTGRAVTWQACGRDGVTAERTRRELLPLVDLSPGGVVVIALGVNDSLGRTSPRIWARELRALIGALRARQRPDVIALSAVPPLQRFPALPQPLAGVLGLWASLLDGHARAIADLENCRHIALPNESARDFFCRDGFHPSAAGHARWADELAAALAADVATANSDAA